MGVKRSTGSTIAKWVRQDPLNPPNLPTVPRFGTGEVAQILGMKMWRLQKFLASPRFQLSASRQMGTGHGSRRLFSKEDVYRIGIAAHLTNDGFSPKLVSDVLQTVEDRDLIDFDENGVRIFWGIALRRDQSGPKIELFPSGKPPEISIKGPFYYGIDFAELILNIDKLLLNLGG